MNDEETEGTPHAIPVAYADTLGALYRDLQEATVDVRSHIRIGEPEVTIPTNTLTRLVEGVEEILGTLNVQEKRSLSSLYMGALLGALIGVVGNFFVSLWFQTLTSLNIVGLLISGILLLIVSVALFLQAKRYAS